MASPEESNGRTEAPVASESSTLVLQKIHFQDESAYTPAANKLPTELLEKIYSCVNKCDAVIICTLALLCKNFHEFFMSQPVWDAVDKDRPYMLFQNRSPSTVWDDFELQEWYNSLGDYRSDLPSEIWSNPNMLKRVLEDLNVKCAPSQEDFQPYINSREYAELLLKRMATGSCFRYLSHALKADEAFVIKAVRRSPSAILHCANDLLNNPDFVKRAVRINGECLQYLGKYREDPSTCFEVDQAKYLKYASGYVKKQLDGFAESYAMNLRSQWYSRERHFCPICKRE